MHAAVFAYHVIECISRFPVFELRGKFCATLSSMFSMRISIPYTGIIMSTRENPNIRRETFALEFSQISVGSRTNPGGYAEAGERAILDAVERMPPDVRRTSKRMLSEVRNGQRDVFC